MSTLLSSDDIKLKFTNTAGPPDLSYEDDLDLDSDGVLGNHSQYWKVDNKFLALGASPAGTITFLFTPAMPCPFSSATHEFLAGAGAMIPAVNLKSEGHFCYLDGATGICAGTWKPPSTPPPSIPCNCIVELEDQDPPTNMKGV